MFGFLKSVKGAATSLFVLGAVAGFAVWWSGWLNPRQTLPGRLVDYHGFYNVFWDVACDTAMDGTDRRCYIQYVDVYRPRPDFAAAMVEVVYHKGDDGLPDPHVRFDLEPGLSFSDAKMAIVTPDGAIPVDVSDCLTNTCRRSGDAGREILQTWRQGTELLLTIEEGREAPVLRSWPLENINTILDDFTVQRKSRNLP